jgi:hypothetical protein
MCVSRVRLCLTGSRNGFFDVCTIARIRAVTNPKRGCGHPNRNPATNRREQILMANPQPGEFADTITWRPDQGEHPTTIEGKLARVSAVEGSYGRYPRLELEQDDGLVWAVHVLHDVLRSELEDLRPQIGDPISISYRGKTPRGYFGYRVRFVDGSSGQIDWSRFSGGVAGQEPLPITNEPPDVGPLAGERDADPSPSETDDIPF